MSVYAFDFWVTLTECEPVRALARKLYDQGHEIHIVSAISPGLPLDNDTAYVGMLNSLSIPFTKIHRTDHIAAEKVAVLRTIRAEGFWDDDLKYVLAASSAGFKAYLVTKGSDQWQLISPL